MLLAGRNCLLDASLKMGQLLECLVGDIVFLEIQVSWTAICSIGYLSFQDGIIVCQQGRMDEEVQHLLLQILKMTHEGQ